MYYLILLFESAIGLYSPMLVPSIYESKTACELAGAQMIYADHYFCLEVPNGKG